MFEMAKDTIDTEEVYEIMGGYYSPVSVNPSPSSD